MEVISSKSNPIIKEIKSLSEKKYREKLGMFFVEGEKCTREAIDFLSNDIRYIIITKNKLKNSEFIKNLNYKIIIVTDEIFNYISDTNSPQYIGCVVNISESKPIDYNGQFLVLDHIQDPGNMGTIIRTAVATGFYDIIAINSVDHYSLKVIRSSSSGVFASNIVKMSYDEFINVVKQNNINLLVAEAGENNIFDKKLKLPNNFGLVIGNEGQGISKEILSLNHTSISLPMTKNMESLNAAISASVLMYNLKNR